MNSLYEMGALVVVYDPWEHKNIICIVMGIATVEVFEPTDDILYYGFSISYNNPYYFFHSDIVGLLEHLYEK